MLSLSPAHADMAIDDTAKLYKNPGCICCDQYADYLESKGMDITIIESQNLGQVKASAGVPFSLAGCHTMMLGDYIIEGHVPFVAVERLLTERPDIDGIALAGMPQGSPGMPGPKQGPFEVMSFDDRTTAPFMSI
ncbi:Protein of unknown function, DUF [Modicisalibacter muralis]|uniref:CopG protein n=2 Tax=Modicisalibacter muralis TaxID=119000 RepID=A0A1G9KD24_9GAMM|nr:Protein of unknown function, DUF [Halomonas muralis]